MYKILKFSFSDLIRSRWTLLYLGLATSLTLSLLLGVAIPFLLFGVLGSPVLGNFLTLLWVNLILSFIFTGIGFFLALRNENRLKGFGKSLLVWLFFAVIYDGIFLLILVVFRDYPLDRFALSASFLNPIDLSRILILLDLNISALMGYTGAVFQKFLGTGLGIGLALILLLTWMGLPVLGIRRSALRKDF